MFIWETRTTRYRIASVACFVGGGNCDQIPNHHPKKASKPLLSLKSDHVHRQKATPLSPVPLKAVGWMSFHNTYPFCLNKRGQRIFPFTGWHSSLGNFGAWKLEPDLGNTSISCGHIPSPQRALSITYGSDHHCFSRGFPLEESGPAEAPRQQISKSPVFLKEGR